MSGDPRCDMAVDDILLENEDCLASKLHQNSLFIFVILDAKYYIFSTRSRCLKKILSFPCFQKKLKHDSEVEETICAQQHRYILFSIDGGTCKFNSCFSLYLLSSNAFIHQYVHLHTKFMF